MENGQTEEQKSNIIRDEPDVPEERKALVTKWLGRIQKAEAHFDKDFERMRRDMALATNGAKKEWIDEEYYVANILNRYTNMKVATLYAKNPKVRAKNKPKLYYTIWDGEPESYMRAVESLMVAQQTMMPPDPMAQELVQEVESVQVQMEQLKRTGKTLEYLFNYFLKEQKPNFKKQLKQMVRRASNTGIGYLQIGFQRSTGTRTEIKTKLDDIRDRLAKIERLSADIQDEMVMEGEAEIEELRLLMQQLEQDAQYVIREGLVFDFPRSTEIVVCDECTNLDGFVNAGFVARIEHCHPDKVKERYKVDVNQNYRRYDEATHRPIGGDNSYNARPGTFEGTDMGLCKLYHVQDKENEQTFTICDGYSDFLREPQSPDVIVEGFWTLFAFILNPIEDETRLYPLSDVELLFPMQEEYNRSRQAVREHRRRNRPGWIVAANVEDKDLDELQADEINVIIRMATLNPGQKVTDLIQPKPVAPIDPNLYEVNGVYQDILRVGGAQEAQFGGATGATATESSIGEQSRVNTTQSNVDDLDEFLSDIAAAGGQILLDMMSVEHVKRIVGPGAVWPELSRKEIQEELFLTIEAGSSGRPNKAQELANIERGMPFILQIPGLKPKFWGQRYVEVLFEDADIDEAMADDLPSMQAMNAMAARQGAANGGGAVGTTGVDPGMQGAAGGQNAPATAVTSGGAQPGYPAEGGMIQ